MAQHRREACGCGQGGGGSEAGEIACLGDELGGEHDPHSGQAADEGPVRVGGDEFGEPSVEHGDAAAGVDRLVGQLANEIGGDRLGGELQVGGMGARRGDGSRGKGVWGAHCLGAQVARDGLGSGGADSRRR